MESIFLEITIIICVAAAISIVFRLFKQPAILAYVFTGILLGPLGIYHFENHEALRTLGQLGVTLLLFMLGLELKLKELRSIGKSAIIAGVLQMYFTFFVGFFMTQFLGFSKTEAIYTGIALAFSSTIVIVKLLSDKKDLNSLHGKLALGILLVQDFFAILTIIFLSGNPSTSSGPYIGGLFVKIVILFAIIAFLSSAVFPKLTRIIARSPESLFLVSLAWVFALTALVASKYIGFSIEIGGFLAGLALANTHENFQIVAKMRALRDFFITIFFVTLGIEMNVTNVGNVLLPAIAISAFVLCVKPFIVMAITGVLGYRKRTSFFIGLSFAQISEFSLIIIFLGARIGAISNDLATIIVLVSIITYATSAFLLQNNNKVYKKVHRMLSVFEAKHTRSEQISENGELSSLDNHVIIVGCDQMGQSILHALENKKQDIVLVDFNPDMVKKLKEKTDLPVLFGDIADSEIQERVGIHKAKLVISTVPDLEDNLLLIQGIRHQNPKAKIIVMAYEAEEAKVLYKAGADYVVLPHLTGGKHLAKLLVDKDHMQMIAEYRKKDLRYLEKDYASVGG
ncbi:MAG: cation:proton antiporter [Candidatus Levybacteria bacterium]|nr:cation:proton antiporter [Candidatus Levybacteria bacterium]